MISSIKRLLNSNFRFICDLTTILQYQNNSKFLHNLKYSKKDTYYSDKTFEGYLNCGAVCYITSYILDINGIENKMVKTLVRKNYRDFDHVFIVTNDCILDPTYRQLFRNDIICNNDRFMYRLYNENPYYFLGHYNFLQDLIRKYNSDFQTNYGTNPYDIILHYQNYTDISYKQDLKAVVEDIHYAYSKGACFLKIHKLLNNRY